MNRQALARLAAVSISTLSIAGTVLAAERPVSSAPAAARPASVVGRWNLMVNGGGGGGHPAWLAIEGREGNFTGRFLGGAGSVGSIGTVKVDGTSVEFQAHDFKWLGKVEGDKISGTREKGAEKGTWTGTRAVHKVDVTGAWAIKPMGVPVEHPAILELVQKADKVTGTYKDGDRKYEVADARMRAEAGMLMLTVSGPAGKISFMAAVKGDILDGIMDVDISRQKRSFKGYRQRQWDNPIELFNGKDLGNWEQFGDLKNKNWRVVDGIMTTTGGANIVSKEKFRDFRMHVEFMVPQGGNSGVYLRGRHEIQVSDSIGSNPPSWHDCGALYSRIAPAFNACMKADTWQTFDITLVGNYLTVIFNGRVIIDNEEVEGVTGGMLDCNEMDPGPIYLQGDHGKISYRKITVWPAK